MAEPFGIASVFIACVDCFEYVQFGPHFGRDFETSKLALNCARLRLTRWGESVNIYDDPKLGRQDTTATEIQLAKDALLKILCSSRTPISKKYKLTAKAGDIDPKMSCWTTRRRLRYTAPKEGPILEACRSITGYSERPF
ncbi:prion-inhibition and propagation-domain-containing protein [Bisporella sp. PMI_857]|nr:prion-inhibition and propagation-domain-containing protein [Bisporella sp. PMI_857]